MSHKAFQTTAELITMRESEVLPGKPRTVYRALPWPLATSLTKNMPDTMKITINPANNSIGILGTLVHLR